jgi:hypothetical protein
MPGRTANVTIYTLEKNDVLVAPAKALRFMPNEALLSEGQKIEDVEAPQKVWTLDGNTFKAHKVETGTTNGMLTEIVSGVAPGTEVLSGFTMTGGEEDEEGIDVSLPGDQEAGTASGSSAEAVGTEGMESVIQWFSFSEETAVDVFPMNRGEIEGYISLKEPYDKAGAYGIQGAFSIFIRGIRGDYNNVVGLPAARLYHEMAKRGLL